MAKNKISKEELKSPDAFLDLADRVGQFLSDNWKPIAGALGLALVAGVGYTASTALNRAQESEASAALFSVEKKINDVKIDHSKKQRESIADLLEKEEGKENQEKIDARLKEVPDLEFEKDFSTIAADLENVIKEYESTQSAQMARIRLARLYVDYDQLDKAENTLRPALVQADNDSSVYGLSRTLLASVLSHKGQVDEGIQLLSEVLGSQSQSYLHSEVLLKLGILNKESGNTDRAEEMFRRVTTEFGETEAGKTAKNYLKMIRYISPKASPDNKASAVEL